MKLLAHVIRKGRVPGKVPLWIMRQAGRYLPEYREVRSKFPSFIDFCLTSEAASEVTLQPLRRFDLDAAIIFSDILIVPQALGINVEFVNGAGPRLPPIRTKDDFARLHQPDMSVFNKVSETVRRTKAIMNEEFPDKALIGFAGAPWTVAAYMVEGSGSKNFPEVFKLLYQEPDLFSRLIRLVTDATIIYLKAQVEAGAEVVKIFDSWAGLLPSVLFPRYAIEPTKRIVSELRKSYPGIPVIGFPKNAGYMYERYASESKVDAIALDQQIPVKVAIKNFHGLAIQGNFDNMLLAYGTKDAIYKEATRILEEAGEAPHIFNLGHGILPETPVSNVEELIKAIRIYESRKEYSKRSWH